MRHLIVGLGNIGEEYIYTRHNIGFQVVNHLASTYQGTFKVGHLAMVASLEYSSKKIFLLKPTTYMNNSGRAVKHWLKDLSIPLENLLIIVDDLHLSFGHIRLKSQGGHAGHNGLKSIAQEIATRDYTRLRFGIGDNFARGKQADFVLSNFTMQESQYLPSYVQEASELAMACCRLGVGKAMSLYNKKPQL